MAGALQTTAFQNTAFQVGAAGPSTAAVDDFAGRPPRQFLPFTSAAALTKDDNNDIAKVTRAIVATTSGDCNVITFDKQTVNVVLTAGRPMPLRITRLKAGGTATGIVGLW